MLSKQGKLSKKVQRDVFSSIDALRQYRFKNPEIIGALIKLYPTLNLNEKSASILLRRSKITPLGAKRKPVKIAIRK